MSKIDQAIAWMEQRKGHVTYSMSYRMGPNSYDCSSAVYFALREAGLLPSNIAIGNTETLFHDLESNGWTQVHLDASGNYPARRGDVFIWGRRGYTNGAAGHTGIFYDDHDTIWLYNGSPAITVYRPPVEVSEEDIIYRAARRGAVLYRHTIALI